MMSIELVSDTLHIHSFGFRPFVGLEKFRAEKFVNDSNNEPVSLICITHPVLYHTGSPRYT